MNTTGGGSVTYSPHIIILAVLPNNPCRLHRMQGQGVGQVVGRDLAQEGGVRGWLSRASDCVIVMCHCQSHVIILL